MYDVVVHMVLWPNGGIVMMALFAVVHWNHSLCLCQVQHSDAHNINACAANTCCTGAADCTLCDTSSAGDLMCCALQLTNHCLI